MTCLLFCLHTETTFLIGFYNWKTYMATRIFFFECNKYGLGCSKLYVDLLRILIANILELRIAKFFNRHLTPICAQNCTYKFQYINIYAQIWSFHMLRVFAYVLITWNNSLMDSLREEKSRRILRRYDWLQHKRKSFNWLLEFYSSTAFHLFKNICPNQPYALPTKE